MDIHSSEAFKQGGRRGAKKVMIVITDGESHDSADLQQVIEDSEKDGITRYAIAVSIAFLTSVYFIFFLAVMPTFMLKLCNDLFLKWAFNQSLKSHSAADTSEKGPMLSLLLIEP